MKPFGIRYWEPNYYEDLQKEEFLDRSFQACSWIRDQEYLVDFKYYENLLYPPKLGYDHTTNYLHIFPKVRLLSI